MRKLKSIIGHELRTPLNAMVNTLNLIEPKRLFREQDEILTTLTQSSQSMLTILNDMLDMTKTETGKIDIAHETTDIYKLSQQVGHLMISNARRQGLELLYH